MFPSWKPKKSIGRGFCFPRKKGHFPLPFGNRSWRPSNLLKFWWYCEVLESCGTVKYVLCGDVFGSTIFSWNDSVLDGLPGCVAGPKTSVVSASYVVRQHPKLHRIVPTQRITSHELVDIQGDYIIQSSIAPDITIHFSSDYWDEYLLTSPLGMTLWECRSDCACRQVSWGH